MTTRAQTEQISGSPFSLGVRFIHVSEHPTHLTRNQRCGGEQEVNVIRGALDLTSKQAIVGMTPIDKVCTARLSSNAQLQRLRREVQRLDSDAHVHVQPGCSMFQQVILAAAACVGRGSFAASCEAHLLLHHVLDMHDNGHPLPIPYP